MKLDQIVGGYSRLSKLGKDIIKRSREIEAAYRLEELGWTTSAVLNALGTRQCKRVEEFRRRADQSSRDWHEYRTTTDGC
jgi:hypothetical protein